MIDKHYDIEQELEKASQSSFKVDKLINDIEHLKQTLKHCFKNKQLFDVCFNALQLDSFTLVYDDCHTLYDYMRHKTNDAEGLLSVEKPLIHALIDIHEHLSTSNKYSDEEQIRIYKHLNDTNLSQLHTLVKYDMLSDYSASEIVQLLKTENKKNLLNV